MKKPDDISAPRRKTLLKRTSRKPARQSALKRRTRRANHLDKDVEQELVKVFGER